MASEYWLLKSEMSYCPNDFDENVYLLGNDQKNKPAFFICFKCKFIGEVGVGPVKNDQQNDFDIIDDL